jgi:hypothetical protein
MHSLVTAAARTLAACPCHCYVLIGSASTSAAYWRSTALAPRRRQLFAMHSDVGSGKMSFPPLRFVEDGSSNGPEEAFDMSMPQDISVSAEPVRMACTLMPPSGQKSAQWP